MKNVNREKIYIDPQEAGIRLDVYLNGMYPELSRSTLQKQIKNGNITLNGIAAKCSQVLKADDEISVNIDLEGKVIISPENIDIEIAYEDDSMLVVNKPKNMLTHPTPLETSGTLVNALIGKYPLSDCNGEYRPGIVHRLDRNTSGLLMIAKNNVAYDFLKSQMQARTVEKRYYAVVCGTFDTDEGTINKPIGRHPSKPEKMKVRSDGKPAITHFKVIERFNGYTLMDILLETGRTHQIRVHFSDIGHPIVNDSLYGGNKVPVNTQEQVLQAYSLSFISHFDKEKKSLCIPYACDIIKTVNYLRNIR